MRKRFPLLSWIGKGEIIMKNPLNKRLPRELKSEIGKYIVLFVFLAGMIAVEVVYNVNISFISSLRDEYFF